jgi:hypothetical protein
LLDVADKKFDVICKQSLVLLKYLNRAEGHQSENAMPELTTERKSSPRRTLGLRTALLVSESGLIESPGQGPVRSFDGVDDALRVGTTSVVVTWTAEFKINLKMRRPIQR